MKIAQIAPLFESVPPKYYGGTERVVSYLTEELVDLGHDVTLFASGDSETKARLIAYSKNALRLDDSVRDPVARHILLVEKVFQTAGEFDIIHSHIEYLAYPLIRRSSTPVVSTLHGRMDQPDLIPLYDEFWDIPVTSISFSQRKPLPWLNWAGNVHHGIPENLYQFHEKASGYLAFVGRVSPEKGLAKAIDIAIRSEKTIKIAAKVDKADRDYFEAVIRPLLDHPLVQFIGEIGESEKNDFLGKAAALIFPIDWPEPFGLVMVEALACGTPVITCPCGSVPEIIQHEETGFIVSTTEEAVEAVGRLHEIDRRACRRAFERKFTARQMTEDYIGIYKKIIEEVEDPIKVA